MSLVMTAAPAVEPVSLDAVRTHLRIDGADEDAYLASLVTTSRLQIEAALDLALISQSWRLTLDVWPDDGAAALPMRPVAAITALTVNRTDGTPVAVPSTAYYLDTASPPAVVIAEPGSVPQPGIAHGGIAITFTAGYGDDPDDVPQPIRHAILLLVAHWYETRGACVGSGGATRIPEGVSALLAPYRMVRL